MNESLAIRRTATPLTAAADYDSLIALCRDTRVVLIGEASHGTHAATDWGGPVELKRVRPALPESWEALFHDAAHPRFMLITRENAETGDLAGGDRLERAIGVIYRPQSERISHYFGAEIARQFDAVIHIDETTAVVPLERTSGWDASDLPETYPLGV